MPSRDQPRDDYSAASGSRPAATKEAKKGSEQLSPQTLRQPTQEQPTPGPPFERKGSSPSARYEVDEAERRAYQQTEDHVRQAAEGREMQTGPSAQVAEGVSIERKSKGSRVSIYSNPRPGGQQSQKNAPRVEEDRSQDPQLVEQLPRDAGTRGTPSAGSNPLAALPNGAGVDNVYVEGLGDTSPAPQQEEFGKFESRALNSFNQTAKDRGLGDFDAADDTNLRPESNDAGKNLTGRPLVRTSSEDGMQAIVDVHARAAG